MSVMEFNWFGLWGESETHAHAPSTPSSPSSPSGENLSDYGLAAVFALAVLWGLMGPSHKTRHVEVRTKHVSRKRH